MRRSGSRADDSSDTYLHLLDGSNLVVRGFLTIPLYAQRRMAIFAPHDRPQWRERVAEQPGCDFDVRCWLPRFRNPQECTRQTSIHTSEAWSRRLKDAGRYGHAVRTAGAVERLEPLSVSGHRALIDVHLAERNAAARE